MDSNQKPFIRMARCVLLCLLVLSALACQGQLPFLMATPTPTLTPEPTLAPGECGSPEPTNADVQYALGLGDGLLDRGDWQRAYTVSTRRVSVSWTSAENNAVIFADYLIFECGTGDDLMTSYFTPDNFKVMLSNYDSYSLANVCTGQDIKLWEFDANDQGRDYFFWYWARFRSPTRVLTVTLVFPVDQPDTLANYAGELFPELPACK